MFLEVDHMDHNRIYRCVQKLTSFKDKSYESINLYIPPPTSYGYFSFLHVQVEEHNLFERFMMQSMYKIIYS